MGFSGEIAECIEKVLSVVLDIKCFLVQSFGSVSK